MCISYLNTVMTVLSAASKDVLVRLVSPKVASEASNFKILLGKHGSQPPPISSVQMFTITLTIYGVASHIHYLSIFTAYL